MNYHGLSVDTATKICVGGSANFNSPWFKACPTQYTNNHDQTERLNNIILCERVNWQDAIRNLT